MAPNVIKNFLRTLRKIEYWFLKGCKYEILHPSSDFLNEIPPCSFVTWPHRQVVSWNPAAWRLITFEICEKMSAGLLNNATSSVFMVHYGYFYQYSFKNASIWSNFSDSNQNNLKISTIIGKNHIILHM